MRGNIFEAMQERGTVPKQDRCTLLCTTTSNTTHPQLEVPLLELSSDALHVRNVPRVLHHGFEVLGPPPDLING